MSDRLAFVGDLHGNDAALNGLMNVLSVAPAAHIVFLGDYINKGPESAEVLTRLLRLSDTGRATLLQGNHEATMLSTLEGGDLAAFLKMGGAMTIRSYVDGTVGPDVLQAFRDAVPPEHRRALRSMATSFETDEVVAAHTATAPSSGKYRVSAHVAVGQLPRVGPRHAQIDTGCGTPLGRLTAFLWPSRTYLQVDATGSPIMPSPTRA